MPQGPLAATIGKNPSNQQATGQFDAQLALLMAARHGRNYEAAYAGTVYAAANPSGVTTSAGLATTCVGLILSNPAASGKNLVLLNASGGFIVAPSTITGINLIVGYSAAGVVTHTTALTVLSTKVGTGAAGVGLADSAATIVGTPAYAMPLAQCPVATTSPFFNTDIGGSIILPPGAYAAIGTTIAGPASGFMGGLIWEEVTA